MKINYEKSNSSSNLDKGKRKQKAGLNVTGTANASNMT